MQYIDNDMDDLFKKAGSDYPLKTDNPDFDKVLAGLRPAPVSPKPNYKQYSWLLLLLLLPFGYVLMNNKTENRTSEIKKNSVKNGNIIAGYNNKPTIHKSIVPLNKNISNEKPNNNKIVLNNPEIATISLTQKSPGLSFSRIHDLYTLPKPLYLLKKPVVSFPDLPVNSLSKAPEKNKKSSNSFYIGILAGPDFSTVKYQELNNMGYSIGILAGYKFSKRWSVETGFIYDRKKYYTDGKHFDKTNAGIPPSVYVQSLDGSCDMFEVPLLLRYDFSTNKNRFFATIGATSYFMKKEKYAYDAYASGAYYEGHRSYDNSGNQFFANAQFSIGYNKQLTPKTNLRIEPYIKVPVHDIGIGNLPITSMGIYFSVTQRIK